MKAKAFAVLFSVSCLAGCAEDIASPSPEACGSGEAREFEGEPYCVFTDPIIETRFTCPEAFPVRHDFNQAIVCTEDGSVPPDFEEPEPWAVDENNENNGPVSLPPTCDFGFEDVCDDAVVTTRPPSEIASDLANGLWGEMPDAELARAAGAGELSTRAGVAAQVTRMLAAPEIRRQLDEFWARYLNIQNVGAINLSSSLYPTFDPDLANDMLESTLSTIHEITVVDGADTRTIFTTRTVVARERLAQIFGLTASPTQYERLTIPSSADRAGVLSHPAFVTAHADGEKSLISSRGVSIRNLLCQSIPPAPPNLEADLDQDIEGTSRFKLEESTEPAECAGCHSAFDPPSFALERFDAMGRTRTAENGFPIDDSGSLDGVSLSGPSDLGVAIAGSPRLTTCMARKMARFTSGADIETPLSNEDPFVAALEAHWASKGYTLEALLVAIFTSDRFLTP